MKKYLIGTALIATLLLVGCGSDSSIDTLTTDMSDTQNGTPIDVNIYPMSTLTPELKDAIAYMGNEERLAYDVYMNLYIYHKETSSIEISQFINIAENAEKMHVAIVQSIVQKYDLGVDDLNNVDTAVADNSVTFEDMPSGVYDIPAIQDLYDLLYAKGITSKQDALEVGCMVEVTDINDLDKYMQLAEESNAADVLDAFDILREGSYSHYWSFDKGLKNINIIDGCCSLGQEYCHPEYPQNSNANH